jgi:hypothetical protein
LKQKRSWRRSPVTLCIPLLGCLNGDFGRVRQFLVIDQIHNWVGTEADARAGQIPSDFRLTDEEHALRDIAYQLIAPSYTRQRWWSIIGEYGITRAFLPQWWEYDRTTYAQWLLKQPTRSPMSLYVRLNTDVRNDIVTMGNFFSIAERVTDLDRKREQALGLVSGVSPYEVENARRRVVENALVIAWVQRSLQERCAGYQFALERLVISTPYAMAVQVEQSLTLMKTQMAGLQVAPAVPVAIVVTPNVVVR